MRPGVVAALALVSAAVGAVAVLLVGAAAGWVGPARTKTVLAPAPPPAQRPAERADGRSGDSVRSEGRPLSGNGFDPARVYAARVSGVVTVYSLFGNHAQTGSAGQGSAFVVSRDGVLLTNAHVVTDADAGVRRRAASEVYVEFTDGDRVAARVLGWDVFDDVAALRVDPRLHHLNPVPLGESSRIVVGEPVAAIGSPFGEESSLSVGVVSATGRSIRSLSSNYSIAGAIQTDAAINHGNSGGPLLDARGRAIGINAQIRSNSGTAEGVAFAVPIDAAKRSLAELVRTGRVSYAYLGITTEDLPPGIAHRLRLPVTNGALIVEVKGGPAAHAGLRGGSRTIAVGGQQVKVGGDVIVAVGRDRVRDSDDLIRIVAEQLRPGRLVTLTVVRGGRRLRVPIRVGARPPG